MLSVGRGGNDRAQRQRYPRGKPDRGEIDPVIGQRAAQRTGHQRRPQQQIRHPVPPRAAAQRRRDMLADLDQRTGDVGNAEPAAALDLEHRVRQSHRQHHRGNRGIRQAEAVAERRSGEQRRLREQQPGLAVDTVAKHD